MNRMLNVMVVSVVLFAFGSAHAQQLYTGITQEQCSRLGGTQWTVTSSARVTPAVGECYVPPKFGGADGGSGGFSSPNRAAQGLGVISNAIGGMIDVLKQRNYRLANEANEAGKRAAASGDCDAALGYFDEALRYLRENGDARNTEIVDRNRDVARECIEQKKTAGEMRKENERVAAGQRDFEARNAISNPWARESGVPSLLEAPEVKAELESKCGSSRFDATAARSMCLHAAEGEAILKRFAPAQKECGRLRPDSARIDCAHLVLAKAKAMDMGACYGDCDLGDSVRARNLYRQNLGQQGPKRDDSNPFLTQPQERSSTPEGSRSGISGDPGGGNPFYNTQSAK